MTDDPHEKAVAECRDEVVKRMLATPPQPLTKKKGRDPKAAPKVK